MARKAVPVDVKAARLVEKGVVLPALDGTPVENIEKILTALSTAGFKIVPVPAKKSA